LAGKLAISVVGVTLKAITQVQVLLR